MIHLRNRFRFETSSNCRATETTLAFLRSVEGTWSLKGLKLILRREESLEPLLSRSKPSTEDTRVRDMMTGN
jgi:hypothetical protein